MTYDTRTIRLHTDWSTRRFPECHSSRVPLTEHGTHTYVNGVGESQESMDDDTQWDMSLHTHNGADAVTGLFISAERNNGAGAGTSCTRAHARLMSSLLNHPIQWAPLCWTYGTTRGTSPSSPIATLQRVRKTVPQRTPILTCTGRCIRRMSGLMMLGETRKETEHKGWLGSGNNSPAFPNFATKLTSLVRT